MTGRVKLNAGQRQDTNLCCVLCGESPAVSIGINDMIVSNLHSKNSSLILCTFQNEV
jgi:hypothetical protein